MSQKNNDGREEAADEAGNSEPSSSLTNMDAPEGSPASPSTSNQTGFRAEFDVLDLVVPVRSGERNDIEGELFSNDLNVESPPPPENAVDDMASPSVIVASSSSTSGFLPDILGEERQSSAREELVAKMRKLERLEHSAKELLNKYETIGDLEGQQNVLGMMEKLYSQRETIEVQMAEVGSTRSRNEEVRENKPRLPATRNRSQSPEQPLNLVRKRPSADRTNRPQIKLMPLRNSVETKQESAHAEQSEPVDQPTRILRQNIQDIHVRKGELDRIVRHLHSLTEDCRTNSDRTRLSQLIKRHEESITELDATLADAEKTLAAMEKLERNQTVVRSALERAGSSAPMPLAAQEEESEDDTPSDVNHLLELRAKLRNMQQKLSTYSGEDQANTASGPAAGVTRGEIPPDSSHKPQSSSASQREMASQYRSHPLAPSQERGLRSSVVQTVENDLGDMSRFRSVGSQFSSGKNSLSNQERAREDFAGGNFRTAPPEAVYGPGAFRQNDPVWCNPNATFRYPGEPYGVRHQCIPDSQPPLRMLNNSPRSQRTTDGRFPSETGALHNELYGLSSKTGDGYFVIDNIHGRTSESLGRAPGRREEHSSESDRENSDLNDPLYNRIRSENWVKQTNPSYRNDLSVPNKNSNERRNDSTRSRASNYQDHAPVLNDRDYGASKCEPSYENRPTRDMPVPEVVASLQVIMAEQQKILNSCAQFVSKPSVNYDRCRAQADLVRQSPGGRGKKSESAARDAQTTMNNSLRLHGRKELDADTALLNNQRREGEAYPYAVSPSSLRQESFSQQCEGGPVTGHHADYPVRNPSFSEGKPPGFSHSFGNPDRRNRRSQTRGTEANSPQIPVSEVHTDKGLVSLMNQILKDYRNDLGSLHFMLDSIASLKSSTSRATVASQLGLLATAELDKARQNEKSHHRHPSGLYGTGVESLPTHDSTRVMLPNAGNKSAYGNAFYPQMTDATVGYGSSEHPIEPMVPSAPMDAFFRRSVASPGLMGSARELESARLFPWDAARNDSSRARMASLGLWQPPRMDGLTPSQSQGPQQHTLPSFFGGNAGSAQAQANNTTEERLLIETDGDSFDVPRQNLRRPATAAEQARANLETSGARSNDRQENLSGASGSNGDFDIINYYGNSLDRNGDFDEGR
ncbi:uncharacterized protein LOC129589248 isoform X2 [Paramacrobiotus metropolitanus]|uniref:uncharacterized protein LOC129589248 isoform X2 n=1 Tax=Paramacrobiotus metropolitanus TaxID=2943436 RepID=UPI002445E004|nr:uncharacterized protein LOC129589248 isoform X2 [Paramacrobiotus metropolitanus]